MWSTRHQGAGGPLLSLGEMLEDLAAEETAQSNATSSAVHRRSEPTGPSNSQEMGQASSDPSDLQSTFERACVEVNVALGHSGHRWTEHTRKLCEALALADSLVAIARGSLAVLAKQVGTLQSVLQRGASGVNRLSAAI